MKKSDIFWQTYLNLEKEMIEVSKFIFVTDEVVKNEKGVEKVQPCKTQLESFSPHLADLLVRCCVQIEAVSKELYFDLHGEKKRGDSSIQFDTDCLKLIDKAWGTHNKRVLVVAPFFNLTSEKHLVLRPLKDAHKHQGTYWEKAYQAVKHDRYACLAYGNVRAFLQSLAALYLLNLYFRKDFRIVPWREISKLDYSMGSALFAVNPPESDQIWGGNEARVNDSPYVVTYTDEDYEKIEAIEKESQQAIVDYLKQQPEFQNAEFVSRFNAAMERNHGIHQQFMPFCELERYRINKAIPASLPFEERKRLLLNSKQWNGWINQHNQHLSADEITEENIQHEIDIVGDRWGREVWKSLRKDNEWASIALGKGLCKISIPKPKEFSDEEENNKINNTMKKSNACFRNASGGHQDVPVGERVPEVSE